MSDLGIIKVYPEDKKKLRELYGKPTHDAFRVLINTQCPHPEIGRQYLSVEIPGFGTETLREGLTVTKAGYYCPKCRSYIFPEQGNG